MANIGIFKYLWGITLVLYCLSSCIFMNFQEYRRGKVPGDTFGILERHVMPRRQRLWSLTFIILRLISLQPTEYLIGYLVPTWCTLHSHFKKRFRTQIESKSLLKVNHVWIMCDLLHWLLLMQFQMLEVNSDSEAISCQIKVQLYQTIKHFLSLSGGLVWSEITYHRILYNILMCWNILQTELNWANCDGFILSGDHLESTWGHWETIGGSLVSFSILQWKTGSGLEVLIFILRKSSYTVGKYKSKFRLIDFNL